jgi:hypothetical protein
MDIVIAVTLTVLVIADYCISKRIFKRKFGENK